MKILTTGEYYGTQKSAIDLTGVILSEYDYVTARTDWHFHENPYFMYVIQGNLFDINRGTKTHCGAGSLMFYNWQEAHYNTKESAHARGFHIEFSHKWFAQRGLNTQLWEGSKLIRHPANYALLGKLYAECCCQDMWSEASIEVLLLQLCENMQRVERKKDKEPDWVHNLRQLLYEEPGDVSLASLSQKLGVHPVHISRAFPKYFASSLGAYLRQLKIKQALPYVMNQQYSLTEIAAICGFSDQSHFTRTFKYYLHQTPRDFRKQFL
ncbi:MAG: helix-turn-helix transcriptional regulator [Bacteroidota bacterium]